ncbi:hypothetical protein R3J22_07950 [Trueperella bernardiae]|uniref:hypothetical protein n=1 Tax=Trueperella bernardiae TaxID=59561 RepID=UPI002949560C|nr:hypothetical protein [Trueperella bernardiae]MDV6239457.1 hypothetical protein [Trueperella bernardiae]
MITRNEIQQALPGLEGNQISQVHEQMETTASQVTVDYLATTPTGPSYIEEVQRQSRAMSLGREVAWAQLSEEIEARTPDWSRDFWLTQDLPPKIASFFSMENRWQALTKAKWFYPEEWMVWDAEDPEEIEETKARMIKWIEETIIPHLHEHMFKQKLGSTWDLISEVEDSFCQRETFHYLNAYYPDLASLKNDLMNNDWDQAIPSIWSHEPSLLSWQTFEMMLWSAAIQMRWAVEKNPECLMFPWATEILELKGPGPDTLDELFDSIPTGLVLVD